MNKFWTSTRTTLEMIKWEHSIFALPFALTGMVLASAGLPSLRVFVLVLVCMVSARSAAMAFNRLVDADLDAANPRTAMRAIPAGMLSKQFTAVFTLLMCLVFVGSCLLLNRMTLLLSPIVLIIVLGYSYMKRVTRWSHLVLGLALGIAPSAAWIAVRGSLEPRVIVLSVAVLLWVGGFDVLYACQDQEHDVRVGLNSIPQAFGVERAFLIARLMHLLMVGLLVWMIFLFNLGTIASIGVVVVTALLLYEHAIVSPRDLRRMNAAFFLLNGIIAVVYFCFVAMDVILHSKAFQAIALAFFI